MHQSAGDSDAAAELDLFGLAGLDVGVGEMRDRGGLRVEPAREPGVTRRDTGKGVTAAGIGLGNDIVKGSIRLLLELGPKAGAGEVNRSVGQRKTFRASSFIAGGKGLEMRKSMRAGPSSGR